MVERSLIFPAEEFRSRILRLQTGMDAAGLEALLLTTAADIFYVTGFLTRFWESPARPWFLVIPKSGDPAAIIPSIGADLMARTWVQDVRTWDAPHPGDDGVSLLVETLSSVVSETGVIGTPMGLETHMRMPIADFETVRSNLSPRTFVDATNCVQRVREIKTDAEIENPGLQAL